MLNPALIILLFLLLASFMALLIVGVSRKIHMDAQEKQNRKNKNNIKLMLDKFITKADEEYNEGLTEFIRYAGDKDENFLAALDEYLLDVLEQAESSGAEYQDTKYPERLIAIAGQLDFSSECVAQIRSHNTRISALGCRRAGLYKVMDAITIMEAALVFFSGENQYEILLALARIGRADVMQSAFAKIKNNILINERGIIEILSAFPECEEKKILFRNMIRGDTDYIAALFLKAADRKMTEELMADITQVLETGNKEVRAAAVRSLSTLGEEAPVGILIRALEDRDWEVRALAAKALDPIKTPEVSSALYNALFDQQWWVRQNAARALASHPGYEALFVLAAESGDEYVRDSIVSALENGISPVLLRALKIMVA